MKFETAGSPHIPAPSSVNWVMMQVLIALIPGIVAYVGFFGPGILIQIIIAVASALGFEALMLKVREQPMRLHMTDLTAPVTAVLFALCIPPLMPWWATVIGMFFAIVVAKHLYGGMGFNLFNPAMVGYVVILIAFPLEASRWLAPTPIATESLNLGDSLSPFLLACCQIPPPGTPLPRPHRLTSCVPGGPRTSCFPRSITTRCSGSLAESAGSGWRCLMPWAGFT